MNNLPSEVFRQIFNKAHEHRRSTQQLVLELVRDGLEKRFGWTCPHDPQDKVYSRKIKCFYCKGCGTFFVRKQGQRGVTWEILKPVWEVEAIEKRPMGSLEFDLK